MFKTIAPFPIMVCLCKKLLSQLKGDGVQPEDLSHHHHFPPCRALYNHMHYNIDKHL